MVFVVLSALVGLFHPAEAQVRVGATGGLGWTHLPAIEAGHPVGGIGGGLFVEVTTTSRSAVHLGLLYSSRRLAMASNEASLRGTTVSIGGSWAFWRNGVFSGSLFVEPGLVLGSVCRNHIDDPPDRSLPESPRGLPCGELLGTSELRSVEFRVAAGTSLSVTAEDGTAIRLRLGWQEGVSPLWVDLRGQAVRSRAIQLELGLAWLIADGPG